MSEGAITGLEEVDRMTPGAAFHAGRKFERERCSNVHVQCKELGIAVARPIQSAAWQLGQAGLRRSDDYLNGFEAGAAAVLDAIRNLKSE